MKRQIGGMFIFLFILTAGAFYYFKPVASTEVQLSKGRLGDREYIASTLLDIFGAEAKDIVTQSVLRKIDIFGGACDPTTEVVVDLAPGETSEALAKVAELHCPRKLIDGKVSFVPKDTLLRQVSILYVCEKMVGGEKTLLHALDAQSKAELPPFDETHKKTLYQKFYPFDEITVDLKNSLAQTDSLEHKWQKWTLALCASPGWQTL